MALYRKNFGVSITDGAYANPVTFNVAGSVDSDLTDAVNVFELPYTSPKSVYVYEEEVNFPTITAPTVAAPGVMVNVSIKGLNGVKFLMKGMLPIPESKFEEFRSNLTTQLKNFSFGGHKPDPQHIKIVMG